MAVVQRGEGDAMAERLNQLRLVLGRAELEEDQMDAEEDWKELMEPPQQLLLSLIQRRASIEHFPAVA